MGLALAAVSGQTAEPTIQYEVSGTNLIVTYTGTLYQSTDAVNWTEVASASSPYKVSLNDKQLFFCSQGGGEAQPIVPGEDFSASLPGGVSLDMLWIEPGTFMMGSPEDELGRNSDEIQHEVTLTKGYWLGKYEITQAQYETIMGTNPSRFVGADQPVENVSWNDAMLFCGRLTAIEQAAGRLPEGYEYTLPTEAQWEYACRAGTTTAFNNGTNIETDEEVYGECPNLDPLGWYYSNSESKTHPVGQKKPNAWGLYDMHGNVMEWCQDAKVRYPETPVVDPVQEDIEPYYAVRGGSYSYYDDGAKNCRSAARNDRLNTATYLSLGFRVALAPVPSKDMTIPLTDKVNLDMIWIEPGTFIMGSPEDELGRQWVETQHEVTLTQGYWLGKFEVTQAQYEAVMGKNPSHNYGIGNDYPVYYVSWNDAMEFCAKLTEREKTAGRLPEGYEYTLPTEAQWEYACRAGTTTALNNGKNLSDREECPEMGEVGWYYYNNEIDGKQTTHPVGQKQPNDWGLYDMHGNVWEWCSDWYDGGYTDSAVTDPTGPDTGSDRVMRGGSWVYVAYFCRSACRNSGEPNVAKSSIGFRVALAPVPSKDMTIPLAEDVDLDMIWIEPGTFIMGSPSDELGRYDDEVQHEVTLTQGYWLGKYEVTQAQYEAVMGTNPSGFKGADLPVEKVSWYDAKEFCAKLTAFEKATGRLPEGYEYTLPTEAQWEYACRAGTTTALNSGKNLSDKDQCLEMDEVGWYKYNSDRATHPVGQKLPNVWGLYDMHGNVWEWCLDRYGDYPTSAVTDPTGPIMGSSRVIRGGSWYFYAGGCRSATRSGNGPSYYDSNYGFRVALAPINRNMTIPLAEGVELDMIWVEPGTFIMGSPSGELGRDSWETQHEVTLTQGYWLGKYEVTQAQYEAIMGKNPSYFKGSDLPVELVSWNDAMHFCAKLTLSEKVAGRLPEGYEYTLPTEAQWEYACRAGTTTALNSGMDLSNAEECSEMDKVGWYYYNSDEKTHPVGQKQPNAWRLYDMHGNVYEWCSDWYDDYPTEAVTDPAGPVTGEYRVLRGGSWYYHANYCRSANRHSSYPGYGDYDIGFRVALAPEK